MRTLLAALLVLVAASLSAAPPFRVALVAPAALNTALPVVLALTDGLVSFDAKTGLAAPGLASTWTVSTDGKDWTFTLKPAQWSDGTPLGSTDVAEAWKRVVKGLALIETPSNRKLRVVFEQAPADPIVFALPPYVLAPDPVTARSAGPFVAQPRVTGQPLILLKNARFRDAKLVTLDRLEFTVARSDLAATALYRDGLVDWVPRGGGPGTWPLRGLKDAVHSGGAGTLFLRLNLNNPRLGDATYRRWLASSLDRPTVALDLRGPLLVPTEGPASPPTLYGPLPEPVLTLVYPQGEVYRSVAVEIADQWRRKLGLTVTLQGLAYDQVRTLRSSRQFEVVLSSWWDDYPAPSAFLSLFRTDSAENDTGWSNPGFDAALNRFRALPPGKARLGALDEARALLDADPAVIPLLSYASTNQINLRRWTGWYPNPWDVHPWPGVGVPPIVKPKAKKP